MEPFEIDLDRATLHIPADIEVNTRPENGSTSVVKLLDGNHVEESSTNGEPLEWGLDGPDAPVFMLSFVALETRFKTNINHAAPRASPGLSQAEADMRLVWT